MCTRHGFVPLNDLREVDDCEGSVTASGLSHAFESCTMSPIHRFVAFIDFCETDNGCASAKSGSSSYTSHNCGSTPLVLGRLRSLTQSSRFLDWGYSPSAASIEMEMSPAFSH